jgi:hypothetical protein
VQPLFTVQGGCSGARMVMHLEQGHARVHRFVHLTQAIQPRVATNWAVSHGADSEVRLSTWRFKV